MSGLKSSLRLYPVHVSEHYSYYTYELNPEPVNGNLFDEGDTIVATGDGGDISPFQLEVNAMADMETQSACPLEFIKDKDLTIQWTPGNPEDTVRFVLECGNHGGMFPFVVCETDDSGMLTVNADIMNAYLAEWRPIELWRLERFKESQIVVDRIPISLQTVSRVGCRW